MTLQPIGDSIIIWPLPEQEKSLVIHTPGTAQAEPVWGKIVAIGPKMKNPELKLGQTILFEMYAGQEKRIFIGEGAEEQMIRVIKEENVIAFLE